MTDLYKSAILSIHPSAYGRSVRKSSTEVEIRFDMTPMMFKELLITVPRLGLKRYSSERELISHYTQDRRYYHNSDRWQLKKREDMIEIEERATLVRSVERDIEVPYDIKNLQATTVRRYTRSRYRIGEMGTLDVTYFLQSNVDSTHGVLKTMTPYKEHDMNISTFKSYMKGAEIGRTHPHDGTFITEHFSVEIELQKYGCHADCDVMTLIEVIHRIISPSPIRVPPTPRPAMPKSLTRHNIGLGSVSYKLDGERAKLLFTDQGLLWQSRIDMDRSQAHKICDITVATGLSLDAELYQGQNVFEDINHKNIMFHVFGEQSTKNPKVDINELCKDILADYLTIKPVFCYTNRKELIRACYSAVTNFATYVCDGLMFRINNKDYKFKNTWTIDVAIRSDRELYVINNRTSVGGIKISNAIKIATINPISFFSDYVSSGTALSGIIKTLNYRVVECRLHKAGDNENFIYMRTRRDKLEHHMNSSRLYRERDEEASNRLKASAVILMTEPWAMVAKHNAAKEKIILECESAIRIIDVGSGVGGDANKYKNVQGQVILVEPDEKKIQELKKRFKSMLGEKVTVYNDTIQNLLQINNVVAQDVRQIGELDIVPGTVVMMLFCINFIPPSEYDLLFKRYRQLGVTDIHIMYMDADSILDNVKTYSISQPSKAKDGEDWYINTNMWSIAKLSKDQYEIHIAGTIVGTIVETNMGTIVKKQVEYMVRRRDIEASSNNSGYSIKHKDARMVYSSGVSSMPAVIDQETMLSAAEFVLNSMYRYIHLTTLTTE